MHTDSHGWGPANLWTVHRACLRRAWTSLVHQGRAGGVDGILELRASFARLCRPGGPRYSRRAEAGSMREARRGGIAAASRVVRSRAAGTVANTSGSKAAVPKPACNACPL